MFYRTTEEVITLIRAFEEQTLLKSEWTHTSLLVLGLYYCLRFPFDEALNQIRQGICLLNKAYGISNSANYHETLTVFWMIIIKQFIETSRHYNLAELANQIVSLYPDENLPLRYYSNRILDSSAARKHRISPDLDRFYLFVNSAHLLSRTRGDITLKQS